VDTTGIRETGYTVRTVDRGVSPIVRGAARDAWRLEALARSLTSGEIGATATAGADMTFVRRSRRAPRSVCSRHHYNLNLRRVRTVPVTANSRVGGSLRTPVVVVGLTFAFVVVGFVAFQLLASDPSSQGPGDSGSTAARETHDVGARPEPVVSTLESVARPSSLPSRVETRPSDPPVVDSGKKVPVQSSEDPEREAAH
jgi:hypothetical protein